VQWGLVGRAASHLRLHHLHCQTRPCECSAQDPPAPAQIGTSRSGLRGDNNGVWSDSLTQKTQSHHKIRGDNNGVWSDSLTQKAQSHHKIREPQPSRQLTQRMARTMGAYLSPAQLQYSDSGLYTSRAQGGSHGMNSQAAGHVLPHPGHEGHVCPVI
jgi:hypothetical protein